MEYSEIINEIEDIKNNEFTMDSFKIVGSISRRINSIYMDSIKSDYCDAKDNYINVRGYLRDVVFDKLKTKLGFEDEIINEIVKILYFADRFSEIYILDGNIIVELETDSGSISFLLSDNGFVDITSPEFSKKNELNEFKKTFVNMLNGAISSITDNNLSLSSLKLCDDLISYNVNDLNIYLNHSLSDIILNEDEKITKVLIKQGNELYYFDIKKYDGYISFANNNYKINKLSEMLKTEVKIKRL